MNPKSLNKYIKREQCKIIYSTGCLICFPVEIIRRIQHKAGHHINLFGRYNCQRLSYIEYLAKITIHDTLERIKGVFTYMDDVLIIYRKNTRRV